MEDVAYIELPLLTEERKVSTTIQLRDIVEDYKGCDVRLDFSKDGVLLGIEIIA